MPVLLTLRVAERTDLHLWETKECFLRVTKTEVEVFLPPMTNWLHSTKLLEFVHWDGQATKGWYIVNIQVA